MPVKWLLETDMFLEGNPQLMHTIIRELGMQVQWIKYVPFDGTVLNHYPDDDCVVVYGSLNLARHVQKTTHWRPGVWADPAALSCTSYYAHWGAYLLQQDYGMYPLAEVRRQFPQLLARYGIDGSLFVRPNENDKSFSGIVVHADTFDRWYAQNTKCYDLDPTQLVVVARPQAILSEHRFIVADRKVITGSKYKINRESRDGREAEGFGEAARDYAQTVLNATTFAPHRIFALDIAETPEGYRVMEIGSANSCGLYGCDLHIFVSEASRIAADVHVQV